MKITNKNNLPSAFVNIANEDRVYKDKHYSVTTILKPTRMLLLEKRYANEIEQDVSDMIWLIFGTAVHHILEQADEYNLTEKRFQYEIMEGYYLTGQVDLYNKDTFTIEDYKTASVWKVINADFDDWYKQGMMYAWLMIKNGFHVERVKFHALLKDWSASKAQYDKTYPQQAIYTYEFDVTSLKLQLIYLFIENKFQDIIANETVADDDLPECTKKERWQDEDKWAVMKRGRQSAIKLYDNEEDAKADTRGDYVEKREGVPKRCMNYCLVKEKCKYWRKINGITDTNNG